MYYTMLVAYASTTIAFPYDQPGSLLSARADNSVQILPADVHGPSTVALHPAPADLPGDLKSFLDKYQPFANNASFQIGTKDQDMFTSAGHCFAEYPCFSVERGAMVSIGNREEITQKQVSAVLDKLLSSPIATFDHTRPQSPLSGLKLTVDQATLEVVALPGTISSTFLAGMVFDMYKMQHDDPTTNAIRAVQAKTDNQERPFVALCLYPQDADATQAYNFCIGNELNGSPTAISQPITKRFSLEGGFSFLCGLIKIPILCHEDKK